jgi:predicted DNA-binding transcriptional regulator AlpA
MGANDDEWMSLQDIADDLAIALSSLYAQRAKGIGPRGHKIGKHVRVRREDYENWINSRAEPAR